jgi:hypothetical protein
MGRRFVEIAFTPEVKKQQERHGTRDQYQRMVDNSTSSNVLGKAERSFIAARDGFYIASITENGWPHMSLMDRMKSSISANRPIPNRFSFRSRSHSSQDDDRSVE